MIRSRGLAGPRGVSRAYDPAPGTAAPALGDHPWPWPFLSPAGNAEFRQFLQRGSDPQPVPRLCGISILYPLPAICPALRHQLALAPHNLPLISWLLLPRFACAVLPSGFNRSPSLASPH